LSKWGSPPPPLAAPNPIQSGNVRLAIRLSRPLMKITTITRTIRNTKRLAEIIKVLSAYGFRQVLVDSGISRFLDREVEGPDAAAPSTIPRPVRFRRVLEELGPTFIKCGQILSTRPDLIPAEWAEELKKLQDSCSEVPFSEIYEVLSMDFPGRLDELFSSIEETPIAAASMAQVHRATLRDGQQVVIKVLRPDSRQLVEEDMALLETLSQIVEQYFSNLGYSPVAVVKEFSRELAKEVNLIYEGQSTDRLRRYFENDSNIHFPKVYWSATTRHVLTLEEIHGRLLSTIQPDSLSPQERRAIVAKGTDAVFKQCLRFGFFHADPHPGNIFLLADGSICFIDCGMTGQLDRKTTEQLLISHFQNADLQHLDISTLLTEFFEMLQSYHLQCPGDLMLLTKALTTIEGVAAHFDPTFDVLAHVEPQIQEIVLNRYGFNALKDRLQKAATGYFELFEYIPKDIQRFLDHVRHRRFTLNLEMKRIEHMADKIDLASRVMGIAMIIAALIVGSSILILADQLSDQQGFLGTMGLFGLGLAGVYAVGFVISFLLPKKRK